MAGFSVGLLLRSSSLYCHYAIPVIFAVGFVVFFVVADQVIERKAVVRRNQVDAVGRGPSIVGIQVGATQ